MLARVVLILKDRALYDELESLLEAADCLVEERIARDRIWEQAPRIPADLFVVDERLIPGSHEETVRLLRSLPESPGVVILTGGENLESRATLLALGCEAVLGRELGAPRLCEVLETLLRKRLPGREETTATRPLLGTPRLTDFVSRSSAMQTFMHLVGRIVRTDTSLLILGETGVGKERLARAIHAEGSRADGPFIAVNCGALAETLLESELFGHEEGAFTGAIRSRRGCFELAHRGTVFLDEVGEIPLHLQVKLLRVLQEKEIQRVGGEKGIRVDVRIIAATNRDLQAMVATQRFRSDLFYRLGVVTLPIPPLRERREDIPELVESYIEYFRPRIGVEVHGIEEEAHAALVRYDWPGNVRELINVIERAILLCEEGWIRPADLPAGVGIGRAPVSLPVPPGKEGLWPEAAAAGTDGAWLRLPWREARQEALARAEQAYFASLLARARGRVGAAAREAGIEPRSLYEKMRRHGLRKEEFRS